MANVLAVFATYERRLIGQRTKDALEAKRRRTEEAGHFSETPDDGLLRGPVGRRRQLPDAIAARIANERATGRSLGAIADGLNGDEVPTAHGGARWWPATVAKVLQYAQTA